MNEIKKGSGALSEGAAGAKGKRLDTRHIASRPEHQAPGPDTDSMARQVEAIRRAGKRPINSRPAPPSTSWQAVGHPAGRVVARIWIEDAPC